MTRQKQQMLQEHGLLLPLKDAMEKESSSSSDSAATNERESVKGKDSPEGGKKFRKVEVLHKDEVYHNTYEVSTPPPKSLQSTARLSSPQLTLQCLTNTDNPYHQSSSSAFHPPQFYQSGLLSTHQDSSGKISDNGRGSPSCKNGGYTGAVSEYHATNTESRPSWVG